MVVAKTFPLQMTVSEPFLWGSEILAAHLTLPLVAGDVTVDSIREARLCAARQVGIGDSYKRCGIMMRVIGVWLYVVISCWLAATQPASQHHEYT